MALIEPVPFHFEMDWSEPFSEERSHVTTIQEAWDGTEQRRNLSEVPSRKYSFLVKCLESTRDEIQRLQARVWGGQLLTWWVPYWPRMRKLQADVTIGGITLTVESTADMALIVGDGILLYRNSSTYEVVTIESFTSTVITVSPTTMAWKGTGQGRARLVPCQRGNLNMQSELIDYDVDLGSAQVEFSLIDWVQ